MPLIQLYNKPIEQKKDEMKRDRPGYYVHGRGAPSIKKKNSPTAIFFFFFFRFLLWVLTFSSSINLGSIQQAGRYNPLFHHDDTHKDNPPFFCPIFFFFFSFSVFHCGYCRPREAVETLFYRSCIFSQR